eukprot:m.12333 g.12333  ORF g.12333 m.12333 type:complete len:320 (+) comp4537_c0_seq1:96-1055(+)
MMPAPRDRSDYNYLFKLVLVGDAGTGKTSLLHRYADDTFSTAALDSVRSTQSWSHKEVLWHFQIGIDFKVRIIQYAGSTIKLQLWDNTGQRRASIKTPPAYYRGAHGCLFVYDTTSQESLDHITLHWVREVSTDKAINVLVGTKSDCHRKVDRASAQAVARSLNMPHIVTSAKSNVNVEKAFMIAVKCLAEPFPGFKLGHWTWTEHRQMAQHSQEIVLTLLLCAQRTANTYISQEVIPLDTPLSTRLFDQIRTHWLPKQRTRPQNDQDGARSLQALALPRLPWEMWFEILGKVDVADLRSQPNNPSSRPTRSVWAMLFG